MQVIGRRDALRVLIPTGRDSEGRQGLSALPAYCIAPHALRYMPEAASTATGMIPGLAGRAGRFRASEATGSKATGPRNDPDKSGAPGALSTSIEV